MLAGRHQLCQYSHPPSTKNELLPFILALPIEKNLQSAFQGWSYSCGDRGVVRESRQCWLVQVSCGLGLSERSALTKVCALWADEVPYPLQQQCSCKHWSSCTRHTWGDSLFHLHSVLSAPFCSCGQSLVYLRRTKANSSVDLASSGPALSTDLFCHRLWAQREALLWLLYSHCVLVSAYYLKGSYDLPLCWVAYKVPFSTWTPVWRKMCGNFVA